MLPLRGEPIPIDPLEERAERVVELDERRALR
jgi:hypothetical protein